MTGSFIGEFADWRREQLHVLKQVARLASAHFHDPTDPANGARDGLLLELQRARVLREQGSARGWQW